MNKPLYAVFFIVLEAVPGRVLAIFDASEHMLAIGVPALRILAAAYLLSIPNLVYVASLQGLSQGMRGMALTITRQAVLPVVFALLLRLTGNLNLLWLTFILAELAGIPFALWLWRGAQKLYLT